MHAAGELIRTPCQSSQLCNAAWQNLHHDELLAAIELRVRAEADIISNLSGVFRRCQQVARFPAVAQLSDPRLALIDTLHSTMVEVRKTYDRRLVPCDRLGAPEHQPRRSRGRRGAGDPGRPTEAAGVRSDIFRIELDIQ